MSGFESGPKSQLVPGIHAVETLIKRNASRVQHILLAEGQLNSRLRRLVEMAEKANLKVEYLNRDELDVMTEERHQGVVALVYPQASHEEGDLKELVEATHSPLILVLDGVTDPHNLGAVLRTADAAGVTAVVVPKDRSASLTPVVSKVACGAAETVPFIRVTNLARTLRQLKDWGCWVTGTAVDEASQSLFVADLTGPRVIVMGSEGEGMRRLTGELCDELIYIPMAGEISSRNVSVATGVCLFEVVRQRMARGSH